jgi:hypothetical protein
MITKRPDDVFDVDEIRHFYRRLKTRLRLVLTTRDPRAVLTSKYEFRPDAYVMTPEFWRASFMHFSHVLQGDDALVIEYADLITRPLWVQQEMSAFIGWEPRLPFDRFLESVPAGFETKPLNGLRSFDSSSLEKWRRPEFRDRIRQLLREMPELPERLVQLGYERDQAWTLNYRPDVAVTYSRFRAASDVVGDRVWTRSAVEQGDVGSAAV